MTTEIEKLEKLNNAHVKIAINNRAGHKQVWKDDKIVEWYKVSLSEYVLLDLAKQHSGKTPIKDDEYIPLRQAVIAIGEGKEVAIITPPPRQNQHLNHNQ